MKTRILRLAVPVLTALPGLFALSACESDAVPSPERTPDLAQLPLAEGMLRSTDPLPEPLPMGEPSDEEVKPAVKDGLKGVIISRSMMYRAGTVFNEYLLFNPMSNLLYPGNVLMGNTISTGRYLPVRGQKVGSVTWSSPDLTPADPRADLFVAKVDEPRFSDYATTMQLWRGTPQLPSSAITTFEMSEVKDLKEFSTKFGLGFDADNAKASLSFETHDGRLKTHMLVKFVQKLYTVSMDIPRGEPHLKAAEEGALGGVMPVYISDIFYGRMAYALISTDHDYLELMAALQVMAPSYNLEISAKYKEVLDQSFTQYVLIGGRSGDHGLSVNKGWDGFKEALSSDLTPAEAVPVAITLRYADDNSVARVVQTGQYPVTESYFVRESNEMSFSFRPVQISASAGSKEDLQVWGHTVLTVPAGLSPDSPDAKEYRLVWVGMSNYVKLDKQKQADLPDAESITVTLRRPEGMSMTEFLNQRIYIDTRYHNTNAAGTITGDDLGESKYSVRVKDLLFDAIHNSFTVTTRRNTHRDYSATVLFDLFHDTKDVEEIPSTLRTAVDRSGRVTETRALGSQPDSFFVH